jgi:RNA recognition motif-containing protein
MNLPNNVLAQIAQQYANSDSHSVTSLFAQDNTSKQSEETGLNRYSITEESWKHHAQARAILGNLIGPNGEQLTSTDPYNTTVFVGGLSPLISEETLRTFFVPFGDIHYVRRSTLLCVWYLRASQVKVPAGKHCGFVQFVRKADAERAIEKMQGFPIGGSRIRLSWGRSQCK